MDGTVPLSGEAALYLAKSLCEKADLRADRTWYILACGNPDAAARYFAQAPAPRRAQRPPAERRHGRRDRRGRARRPRRRRPHHPDAGQGPRGRLDRRPRRAAPDEEGRPGQGREGRLQALSRGPRQRRRRPVQRGRARRRQRRHGLPPPLQVPRPGRRPLAGERAGDLRPDQVLRRPPRDRPDLRLRRIELLPEPAPRPAARATPTSTRSRSPSGSPASSTPTPPGPTPWPRSSSW